MGKASEPIQYAVNRLEGAILRGMEHALSVNIAPYPAITPASDNVSPERASSQRRASRLPMASGAVGDSSGKAQFDDRPVNDFFGPFIGEHSINLELSQFDWLGQL